MIKILVCDDERDIVSALRIFLTGQGYEVEEAYDGDGAVAAVRRGGISLCLLDVMMPGTDGLTALGIIRRESSLPSRGAWIEMKSSENASSATVAFRCGGR